jgi:hypothetical protein
LAFLNRSELSKACIRKLDALSEMIKDDLKSKRCELMPVTREGVKVYVYRSIESTKSVRRGILMALISSTLYEAKGKLYSFLDVPELKGDICE